MKQKIWALVLALTMLMTLFQGIGATAADPYEPRNASLSYYGGEASASSIHPSDGNPLSFQPSNANDGVRNTGYFWNDADENTYPDWIQITFGRREVINQIDIFTVTDDVGVTMPDLNTTFTLYGIKDFEVQYLDDSEWKTIPGGSVTGNNKVWREFTFDAITTTAIRVYITNASGFSRVSEIEAWTCAESPDGEPLPPQQDEAFQDAQWMWQPEAGPDNTWMCFKKTFNLDETPTSAIANIAVDSKYYLWVNGELAVFEGGLNRGPAPGKGYYDEVDLTQYLKEGENDISILMWYWGNQGRNNVDSGAGGLLFSADIDGQRINSDASWKMKVHPAYGNTTGEQPSYLYGGYNIGFDARKDFAEDWTQPGFNTSDWDTPTLKGMAGSKPWGDLEKRPIPLWKYSDIQQYTNEVVRDGDKVIMNLPYAAQVTPYLKVNAPAGEVIDIRTDRYVTTGGPGDTQNQYKGHRTEYITKEGVQEFEALDWSLGEQVIYTIPENVEILELGYRESGCDVELVPTIQTDDEFYNTLAQKAQRTLYVCMRDNFMDCPDRERGQWIGDVSSQAPQVFYALDQNGAVHLKKAIENFIRNRTGDVIVGNVPGVNYSELPSQSLNALSTEGLIMQYYQFTGDESVLELAYEPVRDYLKLWNVNEDGSLINRAGNWEWYDHGDGIDGGVIGPCWYYMACEAAIQMAEITGHTEDIEWFETRMAGIRDTFEEKFWKDDGYRSGSANDDRANAMAVLSGLADPDHYPVIRDILMDVYQATPYMEGYVLESLFVMGYPDEAMTRMKDRYQGLVANENTTLWEDFFVLGTRNHAWSGGPLTLLNKYIAGIYPTTPGYETYRVAPILADVNSVAVTVPSIKGDITLNVAREGEGYTMSLVSPEGTTAQVAVPRCGMKNTLITINGEIAFEDGLAKTDSYRGNDADYIYFDLTPGTYDIRSQVKTEVQEEYSVSLSANEGGSILVNGETVTLPYQQSFPAGTELTLEAVAAEGKQFDSFTGSFVTDENPVKIVLSGNLNLTASFSDIDWDKAKAELKGAVKDCRGLIQNKYLPDSWEALQTALTQAQQVLDAEVTTKQEIEDALDALLAARSDLQSAKDVNLALNSAVTVSSEVSGSQFWADKLTDGIVSGAPSTSNCWSSSSKLTEDHAEWAQIDLGNSMLIDTCVIYPRIEGTATGWGFPKDFTISVSEDGEEWTTVVSETNYPYVGEEPQTFHFDRIRAQYVRMDATSLNANPGDNHSYRVQLAEFEVYRTTDPVPTFSVEAPEEVTVNETFSVTVVTGAQVDRIALFNENGLKIGMRHLQSSIDPSGQKIWTFEISIGTVGAQRSFDVYGAKANDVYEKLGGFCLAVNPPVPVAYSAEAPVQVTAGEDFSLKVVTDLAAERILVYNDYGLGIGIKSAQAEIENDRKVWTVTISLETPAESRVLFVQSVNRYGVRSEQIETGTIQVMRALS